MSKKTAVKPYKDEVIDDFDFSDDEMEPYCEEDMTEMMTNMIQASQHQQLMAIELTKLAVEKNPADRMSEENIFAIFKQASKVLSESFPMQELWEKFS
jgi:hypothetical protein